MLLIVNCLFSSVFRNGAVLSQLQFFYSDTRNDCHQYSEFNGKKQGEKGDESIKKSIIGNRFVKVTMKELKNWSKCHKGAESKKSTHIFYKVMVESLYNSVMVKKRSIRYTKYSRKARCLEKTNITYLTSRRELIMASLSLQHINKTYPNGFEAVKDFNLEIADKEFIIFVGPSGCGKSTTLRMIAGLEEISGGTLKIGDKVVNDVEPKDRDIAMVFQNYALYPHMTVYDNMAFGLKLRKVPKDQIDKMVKEAAKILDLEKLLDRKPKALSGGQRQRVAMGRAIVRDPKVFLMDEPLSNLDAKLRVQMRTEISKLHERLGATIIYVTHDQTEAMTLGTRIVVMKDGVVQQVDTPQNLYNAPGNLFVAGFIGSPQMNFLDATVKVNGKDVTLQVGNYNLKLPENKAKALIDGGYDGKTVVMGIRPENVTDDATAFPESTVEAKINVYELLGAEVFLYFDVEGFNMTARVDPHTTSRTGDTVKFGLDMSKVHVFDKETELTITN